MTTWDTVDVDFGEDETGNFGPRLETGSSLYQVDTTATISPQGEVTENPTVHVTALDENVCVSAGQHLSVFKDCGRKLEGTLAFESEVECIAWSYDANFILMGEHNGGIHLIHVASQQPILSQTLTENSTNEKAFQQVCFSPISDEGVCELLVLMASNKLFSFSNIHIEKLGDALEEADYTLADTIRNEMKTAVLDLNGVHTEGTSYITIAESNWSKELISVGCGGSNICLWEKTADGWTPIRKVCTTILSASEIRKVAVTNNAQFLVALDSNHVLTLWSLHSLCLLRQWSNKEVMDFMLLETNSSQNNLNGVRLAIMQKKQKEMFLEICSLPHLKLVYSLQLSPFTCLAFCPPSQETLLVVEGVCENDNIGGPDSLISILRVRCLSEAQPDTRLHRMLHKKQFQNAELFAKQFKLDVELVHKVHANDLLDSLAPWNREKLTEEMTEVYQEQLKDCLCKITDDNFIVDSCIKAALPSIHATLELLNYARKRLTESMQTVSTDLQSILMTKVLETLHRLGTYFVAFGPQQYTSTHWNTFLMADMLSEFLNWLYDGNTEVAFRIWKRHQSDFDEKFNLVTVETILSTVPEDIPSKDLKPWLAQDLIPYIIRILPEGLVKVAAWLQQKARDMEIMEKAGWPQNAVEMCEMLHTTCVSVSKSTHERGLATPEEFATQVCNLSVGYSQLNTEKVEESSSSAFVHLHQLSSQLRDLVNLHTKYHCRLSLAEYCEETTESLTYRMLDRVMAIELIPSTLTKIVQPYMKEHGLGEDRMLCQYIQDLIDRSGRVTSAMGDAPWIDKSIAVIGAIKNPEYKVKAILLCMSHADVPWSSDLENLVNQGVKLNHPSVAQLLEKRRLCELKKMLINYNLRNCNMIELANDAETLVYYILKHDRDTAVEDAMEVVKTYDRLKADVVYIFRLRYLIDHNRTAECLSLLKSLDMKSALVCGKHMVVESHSLLAKKIIFDEKLTEKRRLLFTNASCEILKHLLSLRIEEKLREEFQFLLNDFQNMRALQIEFSVFCSHDQYNTESFRTGVMEGYLSHFFPNKGKEDTIYTTHLNWDADRNPAKTRVWCITRVYRLAMVLGLSPDHVRGQLAVTAAKMGEIETAIRMCRELFELLPCASSAEVLYKVAHILSCHQARGRFSSLCQAITNLPTIVAELARQAVTYCSPDLLADCLELSKCTSMANSVFQNCESGEYGTRIQHASGDKNEIKMDPFKVWTFDNIFKEDGLVLDSAEVTPMVYKYTLACLPTTGASSENRPPYKQNRMPGSELKDEETTEGPLRLHTLGGSALELVQYLHANSQYQLALCYSLDSLATAFTYAMAQDMGLSDVMTEEKASIIAKERQKMTVMVQTGTASIKDGICTLLHKIFSQHRVDNCLALGYMCSLPRQAAFEAMKKLISGAGHHYKRVLALSTVGLDFAVISKEPKIQLICRNLASNAEWGHKLGKLKISFKEAFNTVGKEKAELLPLIAANENSSLQLIQEYCSTFQQDEDKALLMYLEKLLLPNETTQNVDKSPSTALLTKAEETIQAIGNTKQLQDKIQDIQNRLDPYDYERLTFVLEKVMEHVHSSSATQALKLLSYLCLYKRCAPPSQYEVNFGHENEKEMMYNDRQLSTLSKERLPFHPLIMGDPWKIINPELDDETVDAWLPVACLLKLSPDQVFLTTIRNIVQKHVSRRREALGQAGVTSDNGPQSKVVDKSQCQWNSKDGANQELFDNISRLLMQVSNCELAVACAGWVVQQLPMGVEKVMALECCVLLTKKWVEACPKESPELQKAEQAFGKFSDICRRLSLEQVLYQNCLGEPELVALANLPVKLLFKLYEHESIQRRALGMSVVESLPDIHKVANAINKIKPVNLSKILRTLVEKWLPSSLQNKPDEADMTVNMFYGELDTTVRTVDQVNEDEINLKRVIYLLQHGDLEVNARFLINYASTTDSAKITTSCRVRALRCLFLLVDKDTIERLSGKTVESMRQLMQTLLYLVELDRLRVPHTVDSFLNCNKEGLVKGIWKNHSHERRAVRLVADICLDFEIFDVQLWNSILQQLMAFDMMAYLRHILVCLSGMPELWQVGCIQRMWRTVLLSPLTKAVAPLSESQLEECLQSAALLHRCPLLLDMDMVAFAHHFHVLELPTCSLSCLLLVGDEKTRCNHINKLLSTDSDICITILDQLTTWMKECKPIPLAQEIQEEVFDYINSSKRYHLMETSTYQTEFCTYLAKNEALEQLLVATIMADKLDKAIQLVALYHEVHSDRTFAREMISTEANCTDIEAVRAFLHMRGLMDEANNYLPAPPEQEEESLDTSSFQLEFKLGTVSG